MGRPRTAESMLTKIENMEVGQEIFTEKSNGYISDNLDTMKHRYPDRGYRQVTVYTHPEPVFTSLKDFKKIICVVRYK